MWAKSHPIATTEFGFSAEPHAALCICHARLQALRLATRPSTKLQPLSKKDLRRRVQEYEIKGVAATQEMQRAARKVAEENSLLRSLLASRGVTHHEVEAYLRSFNTTTTTPITTAPYHHCPQPCTPYATCTNGASKDSSAPTTSQPQAQPRSEPQSIQRPAPAAHGCVASFDNVLIPLSCFCAPTPMPKETPLDTGLLISCETAATIISEMRGDADRSRIRASLGCVGDEECTVKNTRVLELMDER
ncbi:hypothetical protein J3E73DRAFT_355498 [Bipolaris maydis]|nr:hypothetical protein J3E73DRAFT_355498 [Bipolaris maydis]